jgi:hypothetical protein
MVSKLGSTIWATAPKKKNKNKNKLARAEEAAGASERHPMGLGG